MKNRLRLYSGLVLFIFVLGHFLNLSMGLISVNAMIAGTKIFLNPWHSVVGTSLFVSAFIAHTGIAIWSLWRRNSLRMTVWEGIQISLGFLAPFILVGHVLSTRIADVTTVYDPNYYTILTALWVEAPWRGVMQGGAVLVVWIHACLGLHAWLKNYPAYARLQNLALSVAVLVPSLALAGYAAAGNHILKIARWDGWTQSIFAKASAEPGMMALMAARETNFQIGFATFLLALLIGRYIRKRLRALCKKPRLYYAPGNIIAELLPGATLLESFRAAGIPHASVCGGRGRCSTCRVLVGKGLEYLPSASSQEIEVLSRITNSSAVRLACQLRPTKDLEVTALVRADPSARQANQQNISRSDQEMDVAFLFVDLRGSTRLSEERLPFDVVYILNLFFAEMAEALNETNGHYAQFNGDGLLAIYGLESGPEHGCSEAINGAKVMFSKLDDLNKRLRGELTSDLKIGIGIHAGEAIVGSMGPPSSPIISALGDNVNIAARLETLTKKFDAPLLISEKVAERSGVDIRGITRRSIPVDGRLQEVTAYVVSEPARLVFKAKGKVA